MFLCHCNKYCCSQFRNWILNYFCRSECCSDIMQSISLCFYGSKSPFSEPYQLNQRQFLKALVDKNFTEATLMLDQGIVSVDILHSVQTSPLCSELISIEAAKFLIQKGANIHFEDNGGYTPLSYAVQHQRSDLVEFLLDNGARINQKSCSGESILTEAEALFNKNEKIIELLKARGAK